MKIDVRFFAHLKDATGTDHLQCELPAGARVGDLQAKLSADYAKLRAWEGKILTAIGVEYVDAAQPLRDGDEVSLMPPVQGG